MCIMFTEGGRGCNNVGEPANFEVFRLCMGGVRNPGSDFEPFENVDFEATKCEN